ncbi:MAG: hypothetical protein A2521_12450 [Deltaproteobacteria bacterium RIFOXYD12_FULL_57_12]|nr:MAG: hypothetical protein A2521_12450 [Deltaproteobacteria bacterium RIFOXYD12_FULL_57_12]
MKTANWQSMALAVLLCLSVTACSTGKEEKTEKGSIEKMTDKVAETAEAKITTPMNKARATQELGDERLKEIDKGLPDK